MITSAIVITKITCFRGHNTEKLVFTTTEPLAIYPYVNDEYPFKKVATVTMECAYGQGEKYCEDRFYGVPFELVLWE